jgi:hypothetical protein
MCVKPRKSKVAGFGALGCAAPEPGGAAAIQLLDGRGNMMATATIGNRKSNG